MIDYKFSIDDTVITYVGQIGKIIDRSIYEDYDGYDEEDGPIILYRKDYTILFEDGTTGVFDERKLRIN